MDARERVITALVGLAAVNIVGGATIAIAGSNGGLPFIGLGIVLGAGATILSNPVARNRFAATVAWRAVAAVIMPTYSWRNEPCPPVVPSWSSPPELCPRCHGYGVIAQVDRHDGEGWTDI